MPFRAYHVPGSAEASKGFTDPTEVLRASSTTFLRGCYYSDERGPFEELFHALAKQCRTGITILLEASENASQLWFYFLVDHGLSEEEQRMVYGTLKSYPAINIGSYEFRADDVEINGLMSVYSMSDSLMQSLLFFNEVLYAKDLKPWLSHTQLFEQITRQFDEYGYFENETNEPTFYHNLVVAASLIGLRTMISENKMVYATPRKPARKAVKPPSYTHTVQIHLTQLLPDY